METLVTLHTAAGNRPSRGSFELPWSLTATKAHRGWLTTMGKGIKVAILDTGIDVEHPDLQHAFPQSGDWYKDFTGQNNIFDYHGHGTQVAGVVAAWPRIKHQCSGVAPQVALYVAKVVDGHPEGGTPLGTDEQLAQAVLWAISKGVDIINMSVWSKTKLPKTHEAIQQAYRKNIFVVACAGNRRQIEDSVGYPAKYEEVLAIGGHDADFQPSDFGSQGAEINFVAPASGITTTHPGNRYKKVQGTSFAAPMMSGIMALALANQAHQPGESKSPIRVVGNPLASLNNMKRHLQQCARDLGEPGHDDTTGDGWVDVSLMFKLTRKGLVQKIIDFIKGLFQPNATKRYKCTPLDIEPDASHNHAVCYEIDGEKHSHVVEFTEGPGVVGLDVHVHEGRDHENPIVELLVGPGLHTHGKAKSFPTSIKKRGKQMPTIDYVLVSPTNSIFTIGPDGGGDGGSYGGGTGSGSGGGGGTGSGGD